MAKKTLHRNFFQRILGICATPPPKDADCWLYNNGVVIIDLDRARELAEPSGAFRLEGEGLPKRLLVVHGEDGQFHAFSNKCTHGGRRLDPMPGEDRVQCCSVGKSVFDHTGSKLGGPAKSSIEVFRVVKEGSKLRIQLP